MRQSRQSETVRHVEHPPAATAWLCRLYPARGSPAGLCRLGRPPLVGSPSTCPLASFSPELTPPYPWGESVCTPPAGGEGRQRRIHACHSRLMTRMMFGEFFRPSCRRPRSSGARPPQRGEWRPGLAAGTRLRRAETGIHHRVSGGYLGAYAGEMAWREDHRRKSNGVQYLMMTEAALAHPVSRQWKGYWQRRA